MGEIFSNKTSKELIDTPDKGSVGLTGGVLAAQDRWILSDAITASHWYTCICLLN